MRYYQGAYLHGRIFLKNVIKINCKNSKKHLIFECLPGRTTQHTVLGPSPSVCRGCIQCTSPPPPPLGLPKGYITGPMPANLFSVEDGSRLSRRLYSSPPAKGLESPLSLSLMQSCSSRRGPRSPHPPVQWHSIILV